LRANLASLNPEQQQVAKGLLGLSAQFSGFEKALQPQVLDVFNRGLHLASGLLGDVEPVAAATGKALGGVLSSIDAEFRSGTWQNFFGFMARTAGPDVQLLGDLFRNLLDLLPPVLTALQPLATELLRDAAGASRLAAGMFNVISALNKARTAAEAHVHGTDLATRAWNLFAGAVKQAAENLVPAIPGLSKIASEAGKLGAQGPALGLTARQIKAIGDRSAGAAPLFTQMGDTIKGARDKLKALNTQLGTYMGYVLQLEGANTSAITAFHQLDKQMGKNHATFTGVNTASLTLQQTFEGQLLPATSDTMTAMQKGHAPVKVLAGYMSTLLNPAVHDGALKNQALRTAIYDMAQRAGYTGPNKIAPLTRFIDHNKESLQRAADQAHHYASKLGEIPAHVGSQIAITARGQWAIASGLQRQLPGPRAAAGMYVTAGTHATADDVLVRASKGELIVPTKMVSAGLVDHLRGSIPGFAAGGIIPSYKGTMAPGIAGLGTWTAHNWQATVRLLTADVAAAMAAAFKKAVIAALPSGGGYNAAYAAEYAYAKSLFPRFGWSLAQWPSLFALWQRESGWNPRAQNPSSGAAGIPQDITGNFHGGYRGQIAWGENYIHGRYGTPAGAWAHEKAFNWYGSGFRGIIGRPTLLGVGERGPERVSIEPLSRGGRASAITLEFRTGPGANALDRAIIDIVQRYVIVHGGDVQTALGQPA
jgi:hypothetical protein